MKPTCCRGCMSRPPSPAPGCCCAPAWRSYGYALPLKGGEEGSKEGGEPALRPSLQPVATWKTHIIAIHELAPGDTVGYNAIFTAPQPMRVALLPVGYADGLRRELSGANVHPGGWIMLQGHRAPIIGRISMNLTTIDISGIPNIDIGDEVTLLGEGISADAHARLAGTIPYEILCAMRGRRTLVS